MELTTTHEKSTSTGEAFRTSATPVTGMGTDSLPEIKNCKKILAKYIQLNNALQFWVYILLNEARAKIWDCCNTCSHTACKYLESSYKRHVLWWLDLEFQV